MENQCSINKPRIEPSKAPKLIFHVRGGKERRQIVGENENKLKDNTIVKKLAEVKANSQNIIYIKN